MKQSLTEKTIWSIFCSIRYVKNITQFYNLNLSIITNKTNNKYYYCTYLTQINFIHTYILIIFIKMEQGEWFMFYLMRCIKVVYMFMLGLWKVCFAFLWLFDFIVYDYSCFICFNLTNISNENRDSAYASRYFGNLQQHINGAKDRVLCLDRNMNSSVLLISKLYPTS